MNENDPTRIEHLWRRAKMLRQNGDPTKASELLLEVAAKEESAEVFVELAKCYREMDDIPRAYASLKFALQLNDTHRDTLFTLGDLHTEQKRHQDAVYVYAVAVREYPSFVEAHVNLGSSLARIGNYDEAEVCFLNALGRGGSNSPAAARIFFNLARVCAASGRPDGAIDALIAAGEKDPEYAVRGCLDDMFADSWEHDRFVKVVVQAERRIFLRLRAYLQRGQHDELRNNLVIYPCLRKIVQSREVFEPFRPYLPQPSPPASE